MTAILAKQARLNEAKRRFIRLMQVMLVVTLIVLALAFWWLTANGTALTLHFIAAICLAVLGSMGLAAALMGLVFFSNASGADDAPQSLDERDPR
jgi:uncharacterized protein (DUF983 family)